MPLPTQLELKQVSDQQKSLLCYNYKEHGEGSIEFVYGRGNCACKWLGTFTKNVWVRHLNNSISKYDDRWIVLWPGLENLIMTEPYNAVFDFLEFTLRDENVPKKLKEEIKSTFEEARSAYRVIDDQIVAIGQEEQGAAYLSAINKAGDGGYASARSHLIAAGREISLENWADSVRESITAVESIARVVAEGKTNTLGNALKILDKDGVINPVLKAGFEKLYGYTNGEEGVRHALLEKDEANVDETDALFMLGACASFVSYLIARSNQFGEKQK